MARASKNKVLLIGNVGKEPEVRYTHNNTPVANFDVATTERWRDPQSGEWKEDTEWHKIVAWKKLAEIVEKYVRGGSHVIIEGSIKTNVWKKSETETVYQKQIKAHEIQVINFDSSGDKYNGNSASAPEQEEYDPDMPI